MGHPQVLHPAWPGAYHHCMSNDQSHMERCGSTAPATLPNPTSLRKEAWFIFPTGGFRSPNILMEHPTGGCQQFFPFLEVSINCSLWSPVRKSRRGKCSRWPDTPGICRTRCQANSCGLHTRKHMSGLEVFSSDTQTTCSPFTDALPLRCHQCAFIEIPKGRRSLNIVYSLIPERTWVKWLAMEGPQIKPFKWE